MAHGGGLRGEAKIFLNLAGGGHDTGLALEFFKKVVELLLAISEHASISVLENNLTNDGVCASVFLEVVRVVKSFLLIASIFGLSGTLWAQKPVETGVADESAGKLPEATTELSKKAARAISKQDWAGARAAYSEMLESEPDNALAIANLGIVEFQTDNTTRARELLEKAVSLKPKLAASWTTLGLLYYKEEQWDLAVSALTRALSVDPRNAQAHNYLAVVAKARGWTNAAEMELQKAIDVAPSYAEPHFNLALMYLERQPPARELARRHYKKALELGAEADPLIEEELKDEN